MWEEVEETNIKKTLIKINLTNKAPTYMLIILQHILFQMREEAEETGEGSERNEKRNEDEFANYWKLTKISGKKLWNIYFSFWSFFS